MFQNCNTIEEAKILFRRLAKRLHPDHGGDDDLMILLKDAFDQIIAKLKPNQGYEELKNESVSYDFLEELIEKILFYADHHDEFNKSFTVGCHEHLLKTKGLKRNQINGLLNIFINFRIETFCKENNYYD